MNENDQILNLIKERFGTLPTELQETIMADEYQNQLRDIAKKYNLNPEQTGVLEMETTLVMLGISTLEEYKAELSEQLKNPDLAQKIEPEVRNQVFQKVEKTLRAMHQVQTPAPDNLPTAKSREIVSRMDTLQAIENPPKSEHHFFVQDAVKKPATQVPETKPFIEKKIESAFKVPVEDAHYKITPSDGSDHQIERINNDPYRESI